MRSLVLTAVFLLVYALAPLSNLMAEDRLVAWWKFDETAAELAQDGTIQAHDTLKGYYRFVEGVTGKGLRLDGSTTRLLRPAARAPRLSGAFTIEAWIAPQAYPWNWCAIANQEKNHRAGYLFGIDAYGHIGLHLAVNGKWQTCDSKEKVPFMEWSYVVATFDKSTGVVVYINGREAGRRPIKGEIDFARDVDLEIGRTHQKLPPTDLVREKVRFPASYSFDGIIDELKIYERTLSGREILQNYTMSKPKDKPALEWRKWPRVSSAPNRFGATYTRLKFYAEWDALWKIHEHADVVVSFDDLPGKMVFWRGTNYNMNMVTENGRWVGDQSAEGGGKGTVGCNEHMSDKQCRYAHVRIIENNPARVVVHWRYALNDVLYQITNTDPITGWGDWADEYYMIYPDGVAVRHFLIHGSSKAYSITEPATLNQPGERAEDNVELEAVTLANMEGQMRSYSWDPWPGSGKIAANFGNPLPNANICMVNFKSEYRPFYVYDPGTRIIPYGGGLIETTDFSHFPTWNHWPVSQIPSDGRIARAADRFTSSAITSPEPPMRRRSEDGALEGSFLMGLTNQPIETLAPLARSWLQAPKLTKVSPTFQNEGYSKHERTYILRKTDDNASSLEFEVAASADSPMVNPAFVVKNWGAAEVGLKIVGNTIPRGKSFRYVHHDTMEGTDLIVWIKRESIEPIRIVFLPVVRQ
jgi:concanavalin A-like lectin/glucanase superfamily protein